MHVMPLSGLPMHSVWLASMTNPVGQEHLERVGLVAVSKQREVQFLASHGLVPTVIAEHVGVLVILS